MKILTLSRSETCFKKIRYFEKFSYGAPKLAEKLILFRKQHAFFVMNKCRMVNLVGSEDKIAKKSRDKGYIQYILSDQYQVLSDIGDSDWYTKRIYDLEKCDN